MEAEEAIRFLRGRCLVGTDLDGRLEELESQVRFHAMLLGTACLVVAAWLMRDALRAVLIDA